MGAIHTNLSYDQLVQEQKSGIKFNVLCKPIDSKSIQSDIIYILLLRAITDEYEF